MFVLAGAFAGYYALLIHSDLNRPEPIGFVFEIRDSEMILRELAPDSPAARAGLEVGDRVRTAGGREIRNRLDWQSIQMNLETGRPLRVEVARDGQDRAASLVFNRASRHFWTTTAGVTLLVARAAQAITLILAFVVAYKRPYDRSARIGSWVLSTLAVYSIALPYQIAATWRAWPAVVGLALWIPFASSLAISALIFTFFAIFPHPILRSRLAWCAAWTPMAIALVLQLQFYIRVVYRPEQSPGFGDWTTANVAVTALYTIAALITLVFGYRRLSDVTDRRRVRVLVVGSTIGLLSVLPIVVSFYLRRRGASLGDSVFASPTVAVGAIAGLALPVSFAYAILRHRLFDIGFIIRRGLQYALARRVLVSIVPVTAAIFLADLLIHREMPFVAMLQMRGWGYLVLAGLAVMARLRRRDWLDALDRRFFRERHGAEQVLRNVSDDVRGATSLELAAPRLLAQVESALHPEFTALFRKRADESFYHPVATFPSTVALESLPSTSKTVGVLALLQRPLQVPAVGEAGLLRQLPREEVDWLQRLAVELLVPVGLGGDGTEALFILGRKKSEEPYSTNDEDLLMAIGDSLALVLSREGPVHRGPGTLEDCPECGTCYDTGTVRCPSDGGVLIATHLPRLLGGRYRLNRRVGRGGMGTVYAALDTALDRMVAVKVLREDFVAGQRAAERFQSEARIAAALEHPNVVTVHDIGVTSSGRAFFIMELLEGVTLREELNRAGQMAAPRVLHVMRGVCAAVEAAHSREVIHRDLKPENIFLCEGAASAIPKVLDFGLAKALEISSGDRLTEAGLVIGTPEYMAPERLRGGTPSADWDLWALAVIAFEMITGALPSAEGRAMPPSVENLPSAALRQCFARALAADPLDRPTSAQELLEELDRALTRNECPL
jgi:tRNA A-37 threonylcarbamoyl transferase component Bud32